MHRYHLAYSELMQDMALHSASPRNKHKFLTYFSLDSAYPDVMEMNKIKNWAVHLYPHFLSYISSLCKPAFNLSTVHFCLFRD